MNNFRPPRIPPRRVLCTTRSSLLPLTSVFFLVAIDLVPAVGRSCEITAAYTLEDFPSHYALPSGQELFGLLLHEPATGSTIPAVQVVVRAGNYGRQPAVRGPPNRPTMPLMSRGVTYGGLAGPNLKEWIILEDDCKRVYNHSHTDKVASEVAQLVPVVVIPVLICLCTLGNILNIVVLCRYCRTGAKQVFLLALAISDMMVMWSVLVLYLNRYPNILGLDLAKESSLVGSFGAFTWLHYTFGHMTDWILMAFSLERLATFRFRAWRQQSRARWKSTLLLIAVFFFLSALMNSGILVWYYDSWEGDKHVDNYVQPEWIASWARHQQKLNIAFPIIVTISLFATNAYLFTYLKAQLEISRSLRKEYGRTVEKANGTQEIVSPSVNPFRKKPCRMLLACVLLYFLTQGPNVILNALDHFSNAPYCYHLIEDQNIWEPLFTTLALANYSGNFYVYVLMSSTYRTAVKDSFRRRTAPVSRPTENGRRRSDWETTDQGNGDLERNNSERKKYLGLHTDFDRMSLLSHISVLFSASRRSSAESSKQRPRKRSHSSNGLLVDRRAAIPLTPLEDIVSEDYTQSQSNAPRKSF